MNLKDHLMALCEQLAPYQQIWDQEILDIYPEGLAHYRHTWLEDLATLPHDQLWQIEARQLHNSLPTGELKTLLTQLRSLTKLKNVKAVAQKPLPSWAFFRVKEKKKHEIEVLMGELSALKDRLDFAHIIDIGAGQGHLSRILSHYLGLSVSCVEQDAELISLGHKRQDKYPLPAGGRSFDFLNLHINGLTSLTDREGLLTEETFLLGLHTCGPLAVYQLQSLLHSKARGTLNFACCYGKMTDQKTMNLTGLIPFKLSQYALTLASRSHACLSYQDFCFKERVKLYRYGLHLFCHEFQPELGFISVGNSGFKEYSAAFPHYLKSKLPEKISANDSEIARWFAQARIQDQLRKMFLADIVRWQFGRSLECLILLDRALYLQEHGLQVELEEYFEESLSPRNIGLLAYRS